MNAVLHLSRAAARTAAAASRVRHASTAAASHTAGVTGAAHGFTRTVGENPVQFHQTVVHSDGSTFKIRTTSPKSILVLTRDTRNHQLWNPTSLSVEDRGGELRKFTERFSDLGDVAELESEYAFEQVVSARALQRKAAQEAAAKAAAEAAKNKKKKK